MIQTASTISSNGGTNQGMESSSANSPEMHGTQNSMSVGMSGSGSSQNRKITQFSNKLYNMVNDSSTDSLIRWSDRGDSFLVIGHEDFAKLVLPRYFKHNNFSSFVRQLNMYGFHKVPHIQQGVLQSDSPNELLEFANPNFQRDQPELLCLVTRKKAGSQPVEESNTSLDMSTISSELQNIRIQQMNLSNELSRIQVDNAALWQENMENRERQRRHQETIDKILRFLASVYLDGKQKPPSKVMPKSRRLLLEAKYPTVSPTNEPSAHSRPSPQGTTANSSSASISSLHNTTPDGEGKYRSVQNGRALNYVSSFNSDSHSPKDYISQSYTNEPGLKKESADSFNNSIDSYISPNQSPNTDVPSLNRDDTTDPKVVNTGDIINMLDDANSIEGSNMNSLSPLLFDYPNSLYPVNNTSSEQHHNSYRGSVSNSQPSGNLSESTNLQPVQPVDYMSNSNPSYGSYNAEDQLTNFHPGYAMDQKRISKLSDGITKQDQNIQALADILGIPLGDGKIDDAGFSANSPTNLNLPVSSDLDSVLNIPPNEDVFPDSNPVFDEFTNISNLTSPIEASNGNTFGSNPVSLPNQQKSVNPSLMTVSSPRQVRKKRKSSIGA
nr:heat shock transcription factor [Schizosaccharomyces pombe]